MVLNSFSTFKIQFLIILGLSVCNAQSVLTGKIVNPAGQGQNNCEVKLVGTGTTERSNQTGNFTFSDLPTTNIGAGGVRLLNPFHKGNNVYLYSSGSQITKLDLLDLRGRKVVSLFNRKLPEGWHSLTLKAKYTSRISSVKLLRLHAQGVSNVFKVYNSIPYKYLEITNSPVIDKETLGLIKKAAIEDTLTIKCNGYPERNIGITSYNENLGEIEVFKPNIILLVADDLGYGDVGFLDNSSDDVSTPGMDRLASNGTFFTNAYATSPICSPSRTGLITGRYQQRWGNFWYGEGGLPNSEKTIPQSLKEMGYNTYKLGKVHHNGGAASHPLDHGFDSWFGFQFHTWDYLRLSQADLDAYKAKGVSGRQLGNLCVGPLTSGRSKQVSFENKVTTDLFTDSAVSYIKRDNDNDPFYIHLSYNAVHQPTYVAHPAYTERFGFTQKAWDRNAAEWEYPYWDPNKENWDTFYNNWGELGIIDPLGRKRYLTHLAGMDHSISRIMDALEETGQAEKTIIVLVSDNGGTMNTYATNNPLRGFKYMFGEGGIRIPMIVSWPGTLQSNKKNKRITSTMDIFPTLMELAGGDLAANLDGQSLLPLLKGKNGQTDHKALFWSQGERQGNAQVVRRGKWKLCKNCEWSHASFSLDGSGNAIRGPEPFSYPSGVQLYNLETDIGEQTNLADERPDIVQELEDLYSEWRGQMRNPFHVSWGKCHR